MKSTGEKDSSNYLPEEFELNNYSLIAMSIYNLPPLQASYLSNYPQLITYIATNNLDLAQNIENLNQLWDYFLSLESGHRSNFESHLYVKVNGINNLLAESDSESKTTINTIQKKIDRFLTYIDSIKTDVESHNHTSDSHEEMSGNSHFFPDSGSSI